VTRFHGTERDGADGSPGESIFRTCVCVASSRLISDAGSTHKEKIHVTSNPRSPARVTSIRKERRKATRGARENVRTVVIESMFPGNTSKRKSG
jgi:hypothetical protein